MTLIKKSLSWLAVVATESVGGIASLGVALWLGPEVWWQLARGAAVGAFPIALALFWRAHSDIKEVEKEVHALGRSSRESMHSYLSQVRSRALLDLVASGVLVLGALVSLALAAASEHQLVRYGAGVYFTGALLLPVARALVASLRTILEIPNFMKGVRDTARSESLLAQQIREMAELRAPIEEVAGSGKFAGYTQPFRSVAAFPRA